MKRIAILTIGEAKVARQMMEMLNRGSRYRVGVVPDGLARGDMDSLASALGAEGVEFLILEDYDNELPADFPVPYMRVMDGENGALATQRLMRECPDYSPEKQWARTLGEEFSVKNATPPPLPEAQEAPEQTPPPEPAPQQAYTRPETHRDMPPMPKTYLLWAILATIFCCFAAGIVALVFSTQVSSRYYNGNYEGAVKASRNAEIWIIASIVLSVFVNTLYVPMLLASSMLM